VGEETHIVSGQNYLHRQSEVMPCLNRKRGISLSDSDIDHDIIRKLNSIFNQHLVFLCQWKFKHTGLVLASPDGKGNVWMLEGCTQNISLICSSSSSSSFFLSFSLFLMPFSGVRLSFYLWILLDIW
jgi:hypothetical protein